jgi:hypothetical protein
VADENNNQKPQPVVRLDAETLARIEKAREAFVEEMKPLTDAARASSRLTEKDYAIRINATR